MIPFGLTNAPAVLQALFNDVLRLIYKSAFVNLDDIVFFSLSLPGPSAPPGESIIRQSREIRNPPQHSFLEMLECSIPTDALSETPAAQLLLPTPSPPHWLCSRLLCQFVVEADAGDVRVGTINAPQRRRRCILLRFPRCLAPSECNHDTAPCIVGAEQRTTSLVSQLGNAFCSNQVPLSSCGGFLQKSSSSVRFLSRLTHTGGLSTDFQ